MTKRLRSNIQCGLWHKDSHDKPFKVVVFGEVGVGKSEENYSTSIEVDGRPVKLEVIDTAGNCDLEDERKVSYQDGKKIAAGFSCSFFETSAKTDIGVDEVFTNLARQIKESKAPSNRKLFLREGGRFSLWDMSLRKRKSKEENSGREKRLRLVPSSEPLRRSRRSSTLQGFVCGGRTMCTS
ncbi:24 kDa Ras-like protein [Acropora cervicornis]|uniref:24 kDa Ras-like protein n=1 Tax=Acropora cervicornis TaxID=6130 RepID=A0AAD9Q5U4_ACRCE|nr:24 kDa Ras-like protein [Acropora cervicornis]